MPSLASALLEFRKIQLYPRVVPPNTEMLLAKKGGETDEHCKVSYLSGLNRCGAWSIGLLSATTTTTTTTTANG
jgi:hypothetical protein